MDPRVLLIVVVIAGFVYGGEQTVKGVKWVGKEAKHVVMQGILRKHPPKPKQ